MELPNKTFTSRILAGTAAVALSLGVVSCSEAEDAANSATDAASSATSAAGSAINEATGTDSADASEDTEATDGASGSDEASGDTTEVESADGSLISIPVAVLAVADQAGFSAPESVEEGENGTLVSFAEGYVVNSAEGGAQPLVGMIGETWIDEGGLDAEVGLPTGPEEAIDNGWTQPFTAGVINWVDNGSGEFGADIQTN
ncbi:hypothetical protein CDES_07120 [Corynebacterium deserti GIMN1.010]|uniref:Secreted protein n=1 Tax=Corynebacterium deserti GIMN1.010 TaxID=931089 RepID=A0A0M4CX88_9CORY|nr:hypothetical protein [Corynebacterium deserti]ALC05837.1 hypothetical protein CDES_07120 [Corynebacterium deserti GIMN1.010]